MKKLLLFAALAICSRGAVLADYSATFSSGFANGAMIPDGSTIGLVDTRILSVPFNTIQDVNVRVDIAAGWNGDLYAYLVHDSGFSVLLNRPGRTGSSGFGYGDAGFNVTFDDQAVSTTDFHFYQTIAGYQNTLIQNGMSWRPDGRNVSPLTSGGTLAAASRTALLDQFFLLDPNGSWSLYVADLSGGGQAQLVSWGLDIVAAVPEPASIIEGTLAACFLGGLVVVYRLKQTKVA
jgi:subtilisin-like proprotein convertase family protein